jgi:hypothetical protein
VVGPSRYARTIALVVTAAAVITGCGSRDALHPATKQATPFRPSYSLPAPSPLGWRLVHLGAQRDVQGWADHTSVLAGQSFRLFVSTTARMLRVEAYRMGWVGACGGRLVWTSGPVRGERQGGQKLLASTRTVTTRWRPTLTVRTTGWMPGDYLLRLDASNGMQRFVPLTVRSPRTAGTVVLVNAVATWQAYNHWGGRSLYTGPGGPAARSFAVSFDRPYAGPGDGQFLLHELPAVCLAEELGLPVSYATDIDLQADPHLLDGARAMVSMGHDEYYSPQMRAQVAAARDHGVNLAFLGANEIYRRIRLAPTPYGPDRLEINYRVASLDPAYQHGDLPDVTTNWISQPDPLPESLLTGEAYNCVNVPAPMRIVDSQNWLLAGTGVRDGTALPDLVGYESDHVNLDYSTARPLEILAHSPVTCTGPPGQRSWSSIADTTYGSSASGAAVFTSGTIYWVCSLTRSCPVVISRSTQRFTRTVTATVLEVFAAGPAGRSHPALDNLNRFGLIARNSRLPVTTAHVP